MSGDDRVTYLLTEILNEEADRAPDHLLGSVLAGLQSAPQRLRWRSILGPVPRLSSGAARIAGAAAMLMLAVLVVGLWARSSGIGDAEPPLPLGTPGPLAPGNYAVDLVVPAGMQVGLRIPPGAVGWEAGGADFVGKPPFVDPPGGVMLAFNVPQAVVRDPCQATGGWNVVGPTVDDFADAIASVPNATVEGLAETEISGFRGKHVGLSVDDDLSDCYIEGLGLYWILPNTMRMVGAGHRVDLWILDIDGTRLVIEASHVADARPADIAILDQVVESLRIEAAE